MVAWQIPLGNTVMRAENNTNDHYQDNRVQWLLGPSSRGHLRAYVAAGFVGFLFGRGADGNTCACDSARDGVTNPAPIDGNTTPSVSADDDGGYFKQQSAQVLQGKATRTARLNDHPLPGAPSRRRATTTRPGLAPRWYAANALLMRQEERRFLNRVRKFDSCRGH